MSVVVDIDWHFDNLRGSHHQSQTEWISPYGVHWTNESTLESRFTNLELKRCKQLIKLLHCTKDVLTESQVDARLHLGTLETSRAREATSCTYVKCGRWKRCEYVYLKGKPQNSCTFLDEVISYTFFKSVTLVLAVVKKVYSSSISISFTKQKQPKLWLTKRQEPFNGITLQNGVSLELW